MQIERGWRGGAAALAVAVGIALAAGADALTLADLDAGTSFTTGSLTFSGFQVTVSGDVSADLADYPVQVLPDGFRLSGPLSVLLGDTATLLLSYDVTADDPILYGASLFAPGTTIGSGSQAWVGESLLGPANQVLGSLFVFDIEGVGSDPDDVVGFATTSSVSVAKTVHLGSGSFAAIPVIDQRFLFVPEPVSMWLLTAGLVGLAWWRPRRLLAN